MTRSVYRAYKRPRRSFGSVWISLFAVSLISLDESRELFVCSLRLFEIRRITARTHRNAFPSYLRGSILIIRQEKCHHLFDGRWSASE